MHPLLADPFVQARIEEAVAPFVDRLPAEEVEWMREQLAETLASDEAARAALERARPRVVEESGAVARGASVTNIDARRPKGAAG